MCRINEWPPEEDGLMSRAESSRNFAIYLNNNYVFPIFSGWDCGYVTNLYFSVDLIHP